MTAQIERRGRFQVESPASVQGVVLIGVVADLNLARQLATSIVEALRQEGHILIAKGKGEALLRELADHIDPTLTRVAPRILRTEVHGEVTSTFGDERPTKPSKPWSRCCAQRSSIRKA